MLFLQTPLLLIVVAVVHRYTQKTWAFLVGQRHRQTPEISQGNAHVYDVGIYHCF